MECLQIALATPETLSGPSDLRPESVHFLYAPQHSVTKAARIQLLAPTSSWQRLLSILLGISGQSNKRIPRPPARDHGLETQSAICSSIKLGRRRCWRRGLGLSHRLQELNADDTGAAQRCRCHCDPHHCLELPGAPATGVMCRSAKHQGLSLLDWGPAAPVVGCSRVESDNLARTGA